jgi:phage head maturation protease
MKTLKYYSGDISLNEDLKFIEANILHYGVANENRWRPMAGCLDAFFERLNASGKGVAACYQHDETQLIGVWREFATSAEGVLSAKLYFVETPFVRDTVIPQVQAGILQGASPTIAPYRMKFGADDVEEIVEGVLCEVSLVGLPADFQADILRMSAKMEASKREQEREQENNNFEVNLLTI